MLVITNVYMEELRVIVSFDENIIMFNKGRYKRERKVDFDTCLPLTKPSCFCPKKGLMNSLR